MEGTSELIAHGTATILSIGTANPPNVILQKEYPDFYFKATGSEDLKDLKRKFQRICDRTDIRKRHLYLNEEILEASPNIASFDAPSIEDRLGIAAEELPRLAKEASLKAIKEWGRPVKDITHLVFNTTLAATMPGADYALVKMLGLNANVKRTMLYMQGCFAGGTILRHAKDIVENNRGARVLAVTSETNAMMFRKPHPDHIDNIIGQALFGDGAAAVVVGCGPLETEERAVFEVCETEQVILPDLGPGDKAPIEGRLDMAGISLNLVKELPDIVSGNLEELMERVVGDTLGIHDWNELFWVAHPGGRGILDAIEVRMRLAPECLSASRHVLREYGNMSSVCVLFVLDETRKRSLQEGFATTGEGKEWGILLGFGPGVTVEAVLLRSVPTIA